jgi:hypothetical protein
VQGKALEYAIVQHELDGLTWLRDELVSRDRDLNDVRTMVARASLGIKSR